MEHHVKSAFGRTGSIALFILAFLCFVGFVRNALAADSDIRLAVSLHGNVHIVLADGRSVDVKSEQDQSGVEDIKVAPDHKTAGWLVLYPNADGPGFDALTGKLVIWRDGKVLHHFDTDQVFYSWSFFRDGSQVSYHTGPTHGERSSHCELHDVSDGRLIEKWDGVLDSNTQRPDWVAPLKR